MTANPAPVEPRVPLAEAQHVAGAALDLLSGHCERIEVAGSIRRGVATVKDVEIVVIPKPTLLGYLDGLVEVEKIAKAVYSDGKTRWGSLYRGFTFLGMKVELFLTDAESWGYIYWLRTGPGPANKYVMKYLKAMDAPIMIASGSVWTQDGVKIILPTEQRFFDLLGMPKLAPQNRSAEAYKTFLTRRHVLPDPERFTFVPAIQQFSFLSASAARYLMEDEPTTSRSGTTVQPDFDWGWDKDVPSERKVIGHYREPGSSIWSPYNAVSLLRREARLREAGIRDSAEYRPSKSK